ncbi:hypothetical protein BH20VER3_BH20VER3_12300 [soil metagenome]
MCHRILTKWVAPLAAVVALPMSPLPAQELPQSEDSFDVEPPLLIPPVDPSRIADSSQEDSPEAERDIGKLTQQLERAKKSAASAERLVKIGVLAKVEAEQRALRFARLEAALAHAQMIAAQEQVALLQTRAAAGQATQAEVDTAEVTLTRASAAATTAKDNYHKAQLEAAERDLRRQKRLLGQGSARKSDVTRAEEKLAKLQGNEPPSP